MNDFLDDANNFNQTKGFSNTNEINPNFSPKEIEDLQGEVFLIKIGCILIISLVTMIFGYIPFLW